MGYFLLEPHVVSENNSLDGADIRLWNILASKLNLCGTFMGGSSPLTTFMMVSNVILGRIIEQQLNNVSLFDRLHLEQLNLP